MAKKRTSILSILIALVILAVIVVLSIIFPPFRQGINALFKGLWWLITSPFRLIDWIIRKCRKTPETSTGGAKRTRSKKK